MYKEIKRIVKAAIHRGWRLEEGGKHHIIVHPSGRFVSFSRSPSCRYAANNVQRDIERIEKEVAKKEKQSGNS